MQKTTPQESDLIPFAVADLPLVKVAVVIAPHPDDEVFGCGGAVARLVANGTRVVPIILTDGGHGHFGADADRFAESRAAAEFLGTTAPEFFALPDRGLRFSDQLVEALRARISDLKADIVFAPSPWELHPDHVATSLASVSAVAGMSTQPLLYLYEISAPLQPNVLIDISEQAAIKAQALKCFPSQLACQSYDRQMASLNQFRTYTLPAEVTAAEAYYLMGGDDFSAVPTSRFAQQLTNLQQLQWRISDASRPLVSILIRSAGRATLIKALTSVAAQSYPNIEIVILDVSGKNALPARLPGSAFSLRTLTSPQPLSRVEAANRLLAEAKGAFALFLDDDDWLLPEHVSRLVSKMEAKAEAVVAYAGVDCVAQDDDGEWRSVRCFDEPFEIARLHVENFLPIHACLFRLALVSDLRLDPDFDLFEDWDWWLQLSQCGPFFHCPGVSAVYRIHGEGGLGVHADEDRASTALNQILQKWVPKTTPDHARELVAYARRLREGMRKNLALADERAAALSHLEAQVDQVKRGYEAEIERLNQALQGAVTKFELEYQLRQRTESGYEAEIVRTAEQVEKVRQQYEAEIARLAAVLEDSQRQYESEIERLNALRQEGNARYEHEIARIAAEQAKATNNYDAVLHRLGEHVTKLVDQLAEMDQSARKSISDQEAFWRAHIAKYEAELASQREKEQALRLAYESEQSRLVLESESRLALAAHNYESEIHRLTNVLSNNEEAHRQVLVSKLEALARLESEQSELSRLHAQARADAHELQIQLASAEERTIAAVQVYESSLSWRLTRPLRWLSSRLK